MRYFLGLDVGSTTVKTALVGENGNCLAEPTYSLSSGKPIAALLSPLRELSSLYDIDVAVAVTGSGREVVRQCLELSDEHLVTEIVAHAYGTWAAYASVSTIIDIGGQDTKIIHLDCEKGCFRIADFFMNEVCAAGTGAFLEMHSRDLGFASIDDFVREALRSRHSVQLAGRCSVLTQSDIVHLLQRGFEKSDIAAALCRAVIQNVLTLASSKKPKLPVFFQGGVAANGAVVRALRDELKVEERDLIVPRYHKTMGAVGAATFLSSKSGIEKVPLRTIVKKLGQSRPRDMGYLRSLPALRRVTMRAEETSKERKLVKGKSVCLGLDVGSSSVKLAAVDTLGEIQFSYYRLHDGNSIKVLYEGLEALKHALDDVTVKAVGVTGSGRNLAQLVVGADYNFDEITAQGAGARKLMAGVQSVFEIGGQDSKFIKISNENVTSFEMNRICASGTGSFVMEAGKILGASSAAELDAMALSALRPLPMNSRCCVFAKSEMVSMLNGGLPPADVAAGVFYAVAGNYLNLVVGTRLEGKRVLFLGGLAKQYRAMSAALKRLLPDIDLRVSEYSDVSGALGAALMALQQSRPSARSQFRGFSPKDANRSVFEFECEKCANHCSIKKWTMEGGRSLFSGSVCDRYEGVCGGKIKGEDFVEKYLKVLSSFEVHVRGQRAEEPVGVPRALLYYEQGPLWLGFLRGLSLSVMVSDAGRKSLQYGTVLSPLNMVCLPIKALIGHIEDLRRKGIKRIFWPTVVEWERRRGAVRGDNCLLMQASADTYLRTVFPDLEIISPVFSHVGRNPDWRNELVSCGMQFGRNRAEALAAVEEGVRLQENFVKEKTELASDFLSRARAGGLSILIVGRDYSCAPELNMSVARQFARLGAAVAPLAIFEAYDTDRVEPQHFDLVFRASQRAGLGLKKVLEQSQNIFPVLTNAFLCRQDSCMVPFLTSLIGTRPLLHITLDENAGNTGFQTRCEAFWNVIKSTQKKQRASELMDPFYSFDVRSKFRRSSGIVWLSPLLRFYAEGYRSIGFDVKFFPSNGCEDIDRGRKYFSDGEPCLPFIREAGQLEALVTKGEFDPKNDFIHVAGTRHCASTTLPALYRRVLDKMGCPLVRIFSPREGLDSAELIEFLGPKFVQNVTRGLLAEQYLKKVLLSVRPYEKSKGQADATLQDCVEQVYGCIRTGQGYFEALDRAARRMAEIPVQSLRNRPRILVTGEYVVRTDSALNYDIHKLIEAYGGQAVGTPLFSDYIEYLSLRRAGYLWGMGQHLKSVREFFAMSFLAHDIRRVKRVFMRYIPDEVEPDPVQTIPRFQRLLNSRLDPILLLEFYQSYWRMRPVASLHGIVNVFPFGCCISSAVEPLIKHMFGSRVPFLSLSFDGQANVHNENRLAAFMETLKLSGKCEYAQTREAA